MLIVDDNEMIRDSLQDFFEMEGYTVTTAGDGESALDAMASNPSFDVVLLDVMLPTKSGFDVLRESQEKGLLSPVLMLTGRGEQENILRGFGLGAADYVIKPFKPEDLSARVRAIAGRSTEGGAKALGEVTFGDIRVDFNHNEVTRGEQPVQLSELEFDLLRHLVGNRGQVLTLKRLMRDALTIDTDMMMMSIDHDTMMRTVEQHIATLREKIESNPVKPQYIETVYGLGYRFNG